MRTHWFSADVLQCFEGERLVGEAFFNGGEWIFFAREGDDVDHAAGQVYIEVDPALEVAMREQRQEIAAEEEPTKRAVLVVAEHLTTALQLENRDLVRVRSLILARRYARTGTLKEAT